MSAAPIRSAVLLVNSDSSGSERRYARYFISAKQRGADICLLINPTLYGRTLDAGIRIDQCDDVILLPARATGWLCGEDAVRGPATSRTHLTRKLDLGLNLNDVRRLLEARRITHLHAVMTGIYLSLPFFFSSTLKTIVSVPAVDLLTMAPRHLAGLPVMPYLLRTALRRADAIDAVSPTVRESVVKQGVLRERVHVSPCTFTDYERFAPAARKEDWVVFAGRFNAGKNPLLFLQAIPEVHRAHPHVRFLMFGTGPLADAITNEVARLNLGGVVTVRYEADLAPILAQSKIFVSIQSDENYSSQSLLEAMACENAIVASDVGETHRWVDETTGLRVPCEVRAIAQAINALLSDPVALGRKGAGAREKATREHTLERFTEYVLGIYAAVA